MIVKATKGEVLREKRRAPRTEPWEVPSLEVGAGGSAKTSEVVGAQETKVSCKPCQG